MCKPATSTLDLRSDGPCSFSVRSYNNACAAFSLAGSWRAALAGVLRTWGDRAEGTKSLVIVATAPSQINFSDVLDAATVGFNGANQYLNDLWRERVFGATDHEARQVVPARPCGERSGERVQTVRQL